MLKAILARQIDRFERLWGYDASYLRAVLRASAASFLKFGVATGMADRKGAPRAALAAAGIAGTLREDCGPCTQIGVDMAAASGVGPAVLRAIVAGDEAGMGPDAALAWRFANASLDRNMSRADPLREEIVRRWGERGLVALSMTLTTARMYPTLKYALGYGAACSRIVVAGEPTPVAHAALAT
jgi:hypothetical protein